MGCGGSKDELNIGKTTTKSSIDNNNTVNRNVKLDGGNLKTSFDSPSPIELIHEDINTDRLSSTPQPVSATKNTEHSKIKQRTTPPSESGVSNAWAPQKRTQEDLIKEIMSEDESEFGRDGIDNFSSSFDRISRKKSSGRSTRTKESIKLDSTQTEMMIDVPRLNKKQSEETFDPTPLIDVNKFKAANAPKEVDMVDNEITRTTETESTGQKTNISPSNFQDFYDDDEKELMASIEQDFVATALPGVVA